MVDELTNIEYVIEVTEDDYYRAYKDMIFAATLLEKAKLNYNKFLNCKDTHNSSSQKNIMVNDNNKSNTNTTNIAGSNNENIFYDTISDSEDIYNNVISNNTNENPLQDNTTSDIENNSDDTEISKDKWGHKATLLLISLYKEK